MSTIILTGGGTAGHCIPNLALIPYLKDKFNNIIYIGSFNGIEKSIIEKENIPYFPVTTVKLARNFSLNNLTIPVKLIKGIKEAEQIINKTKPDVIFSKGGYVSLPVVIAGKKQKIPVVAHESDFSMGLANKISSHYADTILTSFPDTLINLKKGKYVGSIIRELKPTFSAKTLLKKFNFKETKPILLVIGGSSGSKAINECLYKSTDKLLPQFNIIHICGKNNFNKEIKREGYYQIEFCDNIKDIFEITSVCVSRAGSNTAFELLYKKIPTVFIPLPKGISRGDQIENAKYFEKKGLSYTLFQENLTTESLTFAVNSVYANRFNIKRNLSDFGIKNASRDIAELLIQYIK